MCHLQFHTKTRNRLGVVRLDNLVYVNYNMKLTERFKTHKLLIESGSKKYDVIRVDDFNSKSEWVTGTSGAMNEFVYDDEGLTWADVETAVGASEHPGPSTRSRQSQPFTSQAIEAPPVTPTPPTQAPEDPPTQAPEDPLTQADPVQAPEALIYTRKRLRKG